MTLEDVKTALNEHFPQKLGYEDEIDQILNSVHYYDAGGELLISHTEHPVFEKDVPHASDTNQWSFNAV